jgi:isocitrate/isopropylmalate dehydrogenase
MAKSVKSYKIAVIDGDGTRPDVAAEAVKVLKADSDIDLGIF